jgi:hypothetical protein
MQSKLHFFFLCHFKMEKLDEEERKSRTASVSSAQNSGSQDNEPSGDKDSAQDMTSDETMEITGSEEGRQPITAAEGEPPGLCQMEESHQ